jgi:addiction module HigA family antidote
MDMAMKNPPHPGRLIKTAIEACGLTIGQAADHIGITRTNLSRVINGHAGISPNVAIRLEKAFGGSADVFIKMQAAYDLAQAKQYAEDLDISRLKVA